MERKPANTSTLAVVFGSQVSLAELAGDNSNTSIEYQTSSSSRSPGTKWSGDEVSRIRRSSTLTQRSQKHQKSLFHIRGFSDETEIVPLSAPAVASRLITLYVFGIVFGQLCLHLHDNHDAKRAIFGDGPVYSLRMMIIWGFAGIVVGILLPVLDAILPENLSTVSRGKGGQDWTSIIRAMAAFMGVAFGIRKFAWTSTVQSAFYWGMVNPCLWYILDATRNGFILSSSMAIFGTGIFAILLPGHLPHAEISSGYVSVVAWVASVVFCCSICFGNLGRRIISVGHDDQ